MQPVLKEGFRIGDAVSFSSYALRSRSRRRLQDLVDETGQTMKIVGYMSLRSGKIVTRNKTRIPQDVSVLIDTLLSSPPTTHMGDPQKFPENHYTWVTDKLLTHPVPFDDGLDNWV